ncbi:MAG: rhomboid family intramembrane serine protease [Gemmatimonadaceae bacterium]|nr:rhomboid family intramembrane serine protease [Gemmatimonadaceae bacterium]
MLTTTVTRSVSGTLKAQATVLGGALAAMWVIFIASWLSGGALLSLGVIPRTAIGLRGILFAPFLHGSLNHLVANSIPFVILGWLVMLRDSRHFTVVSLVAMIGSGMMAWLIGAPGSVHIGASGVIFGYFGFLMLSGWYARSVGSILLSVLVTVMWGGLLFGVMPGQVGISWQAHLGGFIGGVVAARAFRAPRSPAGAG